MNNRFYKLLVSFLMVLLSISSMYGRTGSCQTKPVYIESVLSGFSNYDYVGTNQNGESNNIQNKVYPTATFYSSDPDVPMDEWTGTGFALKNNYIVTNYHVINDAKSIYIKGIKGNFTKGYNAEVVAKDIQNDLAILKVHGVIIPSASIPYSIKSNNAEVGEEVFVLGYPLTSTMGDEIKLTTGVISARSGFLGNVSLYQISAPIQPGNSGGPLFDSKGNVIGVVVAKYNGAENVGYAIKASCLKNLMESKLSYNILPQTNNIASLNLSNKVRSVKNYVYYIICSSKETDGNISSKTPSNTGTTINTHKIEQNIKPKEVKPKEVKPKETKPEETPTEDFSREKVFERNRQAALQGNAQAQYYMGIWYYYNEDAKKDIKKAFEWCNKAAQQGYVVAQFYLGLWYFKEKNFDLAYKWWQKAAQQGDNGAKMCINHHFSHRTQ